MNELPFQFEQPLWLLLPIFLVSVAIAFWLYYNKKNPFSKSLSILLFVLRFLTIFAIGLLLMNVLFFNQEKQIQKPVLVIALDETESMRQNADSVGIKSGIQQKVNQLKSELEEVYQIDLIGFDQNPLESPEYQFKGKRTDIEQALQYVEDKYYMLPLEALILISDGQNNQGQNPLYRLESASYDVYPLIIGDTSNISDVWVDGVYYNKVVKQNADFPVDVIIQASQLKAQKANIQIKSQGRVIAQKAVQFSSNTESQELRFDLNENSSGLKQFEVNIVTEIHEQNIQNNSTEFYLQVVESGQKVMLIGNNPHPDLGALASALRKVDGLEVNVKTLNDYPFKIDEEQLIILHGLPSKDERSKALLSRAELKSKAIWYIWTTSTDMTQNGFPYVFSKNIGFEYAEPNPVDNFNDFLLATNWQNDFTNYPPLYVPYAQMTAKKQMSNLFTQKIRGFESEEPLWSFWEEKGINKSYLTGEGIWKWKLYNYQNKGNHYQFNDLIKRVAKYLLTGVYNDRFNLQYQRAYNETDQVIIEAQVLNKAFENIKDAQVSLSLTDEQNNEYPYQFSVQKSNYELDLGFLESGVYQFEAIAEAADTTMKEKGQFVVESWNLELAQSGANWQLMNELATASNTQVYFLAQIDQLIKNLKESQNSAIRYQYIQKMINLIDLKWILILLLIFLSSEWFLRKYFGGY